MKKMIAVLLVLVMLLGLAACTDTAKTKTIYVQTQSLRTVYGQEILTEYTYSDTGNLLTNTMYFHGEMYQKMSRRTSNGITYITTTDADGNESVQTSQSTYDENGNVTKLEIGYAGSTVSRTTYTYDENGNMLTASTETASSDTEYVYTYGERNNLLTQEITAADADGNESYTLIRYSYDDKDYVILEQNYDADGVLLSYIEYTYEDNDTGRTMTYYNGDGTATGQVVTGTYDEHGNLVEEITTIDGEVAQTIVNTYEALEIPVEE